MGPQPIQKENKYGFRQILAKVGERIQATFFKRKEIDQSGEQEEVRNQNATPLDKSLLSRRGFFRLAGATAGAAALTAMAASPAQGAAPENTGSTAEADECAQAENPILTSEEYKEEFPEAWYGKKVAFASQGTRSHL